jgi:hypothetical protein
MQHPQEDPRVAFPLDEPALKLLKHDIPHLWLFRGLVCLLLYAQGMRAPVREPNQEASRQYLHRDPICSQRNSFASPFSRQPKAIETFCTSRSTELHPLAAFDEKNYLCVHFLQTG